MSDTRLSGWRRDGDVVHRTVMRGIEHYGTEDSRFLALALAGEVGELCNLIKKRWQDEHGVATVESQARLNKEIRLELADVRLLLESLARCFPGVDLDIACEEKIGIYLERWPEVKRAVEAVRSERPHCREQGCNGSGCSCSCGVCL